MENPIWETILGKNNEKNSLKSLLKEIPAFNSLTSRELTIVEKYIHRREYSDGEIIFYEGAPGAALYIVEEGEVLINKKISDDNFVELAKIQSPSFFGEIALIDEIPRSAGALAIGKTVLLALGQSDLERIIEVNPRISTKIVLNIAKLLSKRLIRANDKIEELSLISGDNDE